MKQKTKVFIQILLLCLFPVCCFAQQIKAPAVSGTFYPSSAKILAERVKQFLDWAEVEKTDQDIQALISPHAGYDYSGSVAGYGYKLIKLKAKTIRTVVLIGSSHFADFEGISVYSTGAWQTPLGNVAIDVELTAALIEYDQNISYYPPAFAREHSLEVQLPFLQMVLDDFKIVPILMGRFSYSDCQMLSQAISAITANKDGILIVASTDLSHYHPYEEANRIDHFTINQLQKLDPQDLYYKLISDQSQLCGAAAVITTLLYAQRSATHELEVLKYANSGDVTGDKARVVGYLSAVIYGEPQKRQAVSEAEAQKETEKMNDQQEHTLNEKQKKRLLQIARQAIESYLNKGQKLSFTESDPLLLKKMGAFVTIHKQGKLRGCIGNIIGQQPLYLTVRDMAIQAATQDPRFSALEPDELDNIDLEISVLSLPQEVQDVQQIKMGMHGVIVKKGFAQGVFLPQVATETGWTKEEFLSKLCAHKAGLSPDAWKQQDTQLYSFTAEVFGERDSQ